MINYLTGETLVDYSSKSKKKFEKTLIEYGYTIERYCDDFLINVAHKKHKRMLNEDEFFIYKKISLIKRNI